MISNISKQLKLSLKITIYSLLVILGVSFLFMETNLIVPGAFAGRLSIYLLWIIAIPGILKRFKVKGNLRNIQIVLMNNRRQLGILMFVLATMHYFWVRLFLYITNGFPTTLPLYQTFGLLAFNLSILLLVTSNNFAVKKMKRWWQILHYLAYPIMLLLILHVTLQKPDYQIASLNVNLNNTLQYAIPSIVVLILQAASWISLAKSRQLSTV